MAWILRVVLVVLFPFLLGNLLLPTDESAEIGVVRGRVTSDVEGAPIALVEIVLVDPDSPDERFVAAITDIAGHYTVTQPISGAWLVRFEPAAYYLPEYYDDSYSLETASPLTITIGTVTSGINASLATIGQITGRLTSEQEGQPVADARVSAFDPESGSEIAVGEVNSQGNYTLTVGGSGGNYKLRFDPQDSDEHAAQFYNDKKTLADADLVTLGADLYLRGVDVSLGQGGMITGVVTSSWRDRPTEYPIVHVLDEDGEIVQIGYGYGSADSIPGSYTVANVPPGTYQMVFQSNRHRPTYRPAPVTVRAGESTPDINAQIVISTYVKSIATYPGVTGTIAVAFEHDPAPAVTINGGQSWQFLSSTVWVQDAAAFVYPDRFPIAGMVAGVAPRGEPGEGTRFLVAIGGPLPDPTVLRGGIYRSGDMGQSWAESPVDPPLAEEVCSQFNYKPFVIAPIAPDHLYLLRNCTFGDSARLFVSDDGGVTWQDVTTVNNRTLVLHYRSQVIPSPLDEDHLYVYDGEGGWYESVDNGIHWDAKNFPLESLVLDAENAANLYGWTAREGGPYNRFGMRSRDGGNQWEQWPQQPCPYSFEEEPPQLLAHPIRSEMLFLRCDNELTEGLYRSDNGGESWHKLSPTVGQLLAADFGTPGRILWARDDGLWASTDHGEEWQVLMSEFGLMKATYFPTVTSNNP